MSTRLDLPKDLLLEAKRVLAQKLIGPKEFIRTKKIQKLWEMQGKISLNIDLDFAPERNKRW